MSLVAYHGDQAVKTAVLAQWEAHRAAGEMGRFVGRCTCGDDYAQYEARLGIPRILASLTYAIFEGLSRTDCQAWPLRLMDAIPVGANLSDTWPAFAERLFLHPTQGVIHFVHTRPARNAVRQVGALYAARSANERKWSRAFNNARHDDDYDYTDAVAAEAASTAAYVAFATPFVGDVCRQAGYVVFTAARAVPGNEAARTAYYSVLADWLIELVSAAPIVAAVAP